jgi:hypothetical protein
MAEPAVQATQQSGVVKGQVVEKNGEPVIGATVKVKNAEKAGTVTDFDGNFELKGIPSNGTIIVSYVGFKTKEVAYRNGQTLNITIEEDAETLQKIIREKNKLIEFLLIKLEELNAAILDKDKAYGERKAAYENSIRILETQLNRCHEQISQKDELINRLFNAYLGVERNVPTAGIEAGGNTDIPAEKPHG